MAGVRARPCETQRPLDHYLSSKSDSVTSLYRLQRRMKEKHEASMLKFVSTPEWGVFCSHLLPVLSKILAELFW